MPKPRQSDFERAKAPQLGAAMTALMDAYDHRETVDLRAAMDQYMVTVRVLVDEFLAETE
jgi:hypothetical protein